MTNEIQETILYFRQLLHIAFTSYLNQADEKVTVGGKNERDSYPSQAHSFVPFLRCFNLPFDNHTITMEEEIVLLLAVMPHISPQTLDAFFIQDKELDRPYTEFGGWRGVSHGGFLPTGQTSVFLLTQLSKIQKNQDVDLQSETKTDPENDTEQTKSKQSISSFALQGEKDFRFSYLVTHLFSKEHWFHKENILHLEGQGEGEPFLSGRLVISEEFLAKVFGQKYEPEYNASFPAKRVTTALEWGDLVLPYHLQEELDDVICWITNQNEIREKWQLNRIMKSGYRCLFYGPPGTGKTLTATLLGKQNGMDVYRVDLSMIVSKYIGETEKNLAKIFDKAEHQNWILFFDEADALFGQRTETQSSNDRHANQEVAYLLQRIEDFPGIVILATNLKENMDEAFFRRFQSTLYFPMPDERLRYQLWKNIIPDAWLNNENGEELLQKASGYSLSGGSMVNVIQTCAIKLYTQEKTELTPEFLKEAIRKELAKEGKIIEN